jgi:pimeloyl-ACP methyl ester carboxylesterase
MEDFRVMAAIIEASAPQVTRIDLADCGHMLTLEAPDLLADTISDFLR